MICWLFLLINCSTSPSDLCTTTQNEKKGRKKKIFSLQITRVRENFHAKQFTFPQVEKLEFRLRGRKEMKSLYFNIIDEWNHAIIKRHSLCLFTSFHFRMWTCLLCNWSSRDLGEKHFFVRCRNVYCCNVNGYFVCTSRPLLFRCWGEILHC